MICGTMRELTVPCSVSGDNGYKITPLPRWTAIIRTGQSSALTHLCNLCTHNRWWLVLGWVTTKEDQPRLRIAYISYIRRVIKFYLLTYLITYLLTYLLNFVCGSEINNYFINISSPDNIYLWI